MHRQQQISLGGSLQVTLVKSLKCRQAVNLVMVDMNVLVGVTVRSPASQLGKRGCPSGILVDLQQM